MLLSYVAGACQGAHKLRDGIREVFANVDLILQPGDLLTRWLLDERENMAPVLAANGDEDSVRQPHDGLKDDPAKAISVATGVFYEGYDEAS